MKKLMKLGATICFAVSVLHSFSQTVTKSYNGTVAGAVCPEIGIQYEVSLPTGFSGCQITWTVINGEKQSQSGNTVYIKWNDTPGAKAKLKATFSNCGSGNEANNGKVSNEFEELILSVKNQSWGSYGNSVNVDYCTKGQVLITMPRMFVQGTGGIGQPAQTEVAYAGWGVSPTSARTRPIRTASRPSITAWPMTTARATATWRRPTSS